MRKTNPESLAVRSQQFFIKTKSRDERELKALFQHFSQTFYKNFVNLKLFSFICTQLVFHLYLARNLLQ